MRVLRKYYKRDIIERKLLKRMNDPQNGIISCGFLPKSKNACVQTDIKFPHYGGLYVISGKGVYIDAETGREYPVYPGCVLQRMPGVRHHTIIDENSDWLEFFFCAGECVFNMLADLKLVSRKPVFFVGESEELFSKLLEYHNLFKKTDDYHSWELLPEFQRLLCYLNSRRSTDTEESKMQEICDVLKENYKVGIPLSEICSKCRLSYESLRKKFRAFFGCSLSSYLIGVRISKAKGLLLDGAMSVQEIAEELGYCDAYAFCHQFKQQVGVSPVKYATEWRNA